jgi:hypothetical protein
MTQALKGRLLKALPGLMRGWGSDGSCIFCAACSLLERPHKSDCLGLALLAELQTNHIDNPCGCVRPCEHYKEPEEWYK